MNDDFIQLKPLEGELKLSHKKRDYGLTVSTKEFVLHKPHVNYHVKLADIVSIMPFDMRTFKRISFENSRYASSEVTTFGTGMQHYKLYVRAAVMHNRSGLFTLGPLEMIIPIHEKLLQALAQYGGLHSY